MTRTFKQLTALLLALVLVLSCAGCNTNSDPVKDTSVLQTDSTKPTHGTLLADPTQPGTTGPIETQPDTTEPTVTEPIATEPGVTESRGTEPVATEPGETEPTVTIPPTTEPGGETRPPATAVPPTTEPTPTVPPTTESTPTVPPVTDPTCSHKSVVIPAVAPTCTTPGKSEGSKCSKCGTVLVAQMEIPATGHKEQVVAGKAPTATSTGLTAGKSCGVCSAVLTKQVMIPSYAAAWSGDYYYRQLATQAKGTKMQTLYNRIDTEAMAFHFDTSINAQNNIAVRVQYSDLGLSSEEALLVWMCYRNDHPLYYWITGNTYRTAQELRIVTDDAYAKGVNRAKYNDLVCQQVRSWVTKVSDEMSAYQQTMAFHDWIIDAIDYAYESDGSTPQDASWAYNVLGVLDGSGAVCEGYARTFQLLLNACSVENIYITGTAGNPGGSFYGHAWNLVKLEDGNWYWYDLTWDDHPGYILGIDYNYFCVNDTQNTNWMDGNVSGLTEHDFLVSHKPFDSSASGLNIPFTLPARNAGKFSSTTQKLVRQSFTSGDYKYAVVGYNIVQFAGGVVPNKVLNIPETVTYGGRSYTVVSIGRIDENGLIGQGCVTEGWIDKYYIPKTVKFLWDGAMQTSEGYVTAYEVDPDSPYFTTVDGVLYTKSLYTLIKYPTKAVVDRFVIPDETVCIACDALRAQWHRIGTLVLGKNVEVIGVLNWGAGYPDGPGDGIYNTATGEISGYNVSVHPENSYFREEGGLILKQLFGERFTVYMAASRDIQDVYILDGAQSIAHGAFTMCYSIRSFSIPSSITSPQTICMHELPELKQVHYRGTVSQWQALTRYSDFGSCFKGLPVVCSDGTITYQ